MAKVGTRAAPKLPAQANGKPLEIVYRDPKELKPDARNSRVHSPEQIEQLRASYRRFGWTSPVLLRPDGSIGAGHARVRMAILEKIKSVPTVTIDLTEKQWRAYAIVDNQSALNASYDLDILRTELDELNGDFNLIEEMGFSLDELADLEVPGFTLDETNERAEETPPVPANPVVKRGELWLLGKHRVLCGDSTKADDVARPLNGAKPHLMVTDPPYGVNYDADWRNRADRANGRPYGARAVGKVTNDNRSDWREAWALCPSDVIYVWHPAGAKQVEFFHSIVDSAFEFRMQIIWAKQQFPIGRGDYHVKHEPCWYAVRKGKTAHWNGSRTESTLWEIDKPHKSETGHSTQKPIECMRKPILNNSKPGDSVYDPFLGSGTTLIAAEMEKRICLGIEIAPEYVEVIIRRWEKFTSKTAKREDGATLEDLLDARTAGKAVAGIATGKTKLVRGKRLAKALAT